MPINKIIPAYHADFAQLLTSFIHHEVEEHTFRFKCIQWGIPSEDIDDLIEQSKPLRSRH